MLPRFRAHLPHMLAVLAAATLSASRPALAQPAPPGGGIIALPLNPVVPESQRQCTARTAAGLGYAMLRAGTGPTPAAADYVLVNYIGYLAATGAVFDQAVHATFPVNGVIPGFSRGLQMLARHGIARLCIPAAMGYGAAGSGPIPANADLVFQVELVDFKSAAEIEALRRARQPG